MATIQISDEDYKFLKDLKTELNTQENDAQADPVYWGILETRMTPCPSGCGEPYVYFVDSVEIMNYEDTVSFIKENISEYSPEIQDKWNKIINKDILFNELIEFIKNDMNIRCYEVWQEETEFISRNSGAFLTKRACEEYIKKYSYNHSNPHTYAMTAFRNFELEHLLKILKNLNLNK